MGHTYSGLGSAHLSPRSGWQERNPNTQQLCLGTGPQCGESTDFKTQGIIEGEVLARDFYYTSEFF